MLSLRVDTTDLERLIGDAVERKLAELGVSVQQRGDSRPICYSLDDAAEMLGLGCGKKKGYRVRDMWLRGEMATVMVGRRRVVEHSELMAYIERQRQAS